MIDTLRHEIPGIIAVQPQGDKVQRATACAPRVEAGNVYLPRPTGPTGRRLPARAWVDDFIEQVAAFPMGAHDDDDVDAFTQLLLRWHPRRMSPEMMRRLPAGGEWAPAAAPPVSSGSSPPAGRGVTRERGLASRRRGGDRSRTPATVTGRFPASTTA